MLIMNTQMKVQFLSLVMHQNKAQLQQLHL